MSWKDVIDGVIGFLLLLASYGSFRWFQTNRWAYLYGYLQEYHPVLFWLWLGPCLFEGFSVFVAATGSSLWFEICFYLMFILAPITVVASCFVPKWYLQSDDDETNVSKAFEAKLLSVSQLLGLK